jgi:hypothetical protein
MDERAAATPALEVMDTESGDGFGEVAEEAQTEAQTEA